MSCEYCRQTPHDPRCPKAPPPEPVSCLICGREFDEEDLTCGMCEGCLEDSYTPERGKWYAAEDKATFIKATHEIKLEGSEDGREWALDVLFAYYFATEYQEDPGFLRDYCLEIPQAWAAWLLETAEPLQKGVRKCSYIS